MRAFAADMLDFVPDYGYTHIITNPPFHAGIEVDTLAAQAFIAQAYRLLEPGGQLILVANRFLRYDRLMKTLFGNIAYPVETGKYHVLSSTKISY
jgi:16S rRNA (guanine1207-N2)-methyltransferase